MKNTNLISGIRSSIQHLLVQEDIFFCAIVARKMIL